MTSFESTTTRLPHREQSLCVLVADLLPLYVEGEISQGTREVVADHLSHCEHCAGFLAGAQSVRVQLRQDERARAAAVAGDQPAIQALARGRIFIKVIVELVLMGIAIGVSGGVWGSLDHTVQGIATVLVVFLFLTLAAFTNRRGGLRVSQLLKLGVVSLMAGVGGAGLLPAGPREIPFFSMLLFIAGVAGIRHLTGHERLRRGV